MNILRMFWIAQTDFIEETFSLSLFYSKLLNLRATIMYSISQVYKKNTLDTCREFHSIEYIIIDFNNEDNYYTRFIIKV